MKSIKVQRKKLSDYKPDLKNANDGSERGYLFIDDSITEDGVGRSGLVDKNGVMIAGNQTMAVLAANGIEDVIEIETTGNEWVIVKRTDTDLADSDPNNTARRMAFRDNRSQEISLTWNPVQLQADKEAGIEIVKKLWSPVELGILGVGDGEQVEDPGADIDRAAELNEKWGVVRGDVWTLTSEDGKRIHRILCGDSTCADDVDKLMDGVKADAVVTDPPYGVGYTGGTKKQSKLVGDEAPNLYTPFLHVIKPFCSKNVAVYLWYADGDSAVTSAVTSAGFTVRNTLIWNKNIAQFGALSAQYKQKHEPFLYLHIKGEAPAWYGPTNETTVWDINRENVNNYHPTQKPPELFSRAIVNSTKYSAVVLDGFLGSGTTIVACEQTGRVGYGMEISENYVAVCLERLANMGLTPERNLTHE